MKFLKKIRESRKLSYYAMAKAMGVSQTAYNRLEEKALGCRFRALVKLRENLNMSWAEVGKLLDEEFKDGH